MEPITLESLRTILSSRKLHFSNRVAIFYADIEQRDYTYFEESMIMFKWVNEIFKEIKDDTVYLLPIRERLLKKNSSNKNNTIENIYFKIATSLAFAQHSITKSDWDKFFYYLLEAEKFKGFIIATQDPKLYRILQNEQTSKGGRTKAENNKQKTEHIRNQAISMYRDLNYRRKHNINSLASFARHFCVNHNRNLYQINPEIKDTELLKESTVKRWINPPKAGKM